VLRTGVLNAHPRIEALCVEFPIGVGAKQGDVRAPVGQWQAGTELVRADDDRAFCGQTSGSINDLDVDDDLLAAHVHSDVNGDASDESDVDIADREVVLGLQFGGSVRIIATVPAVDEVAIDGVARSDAVGARRQVLDDELAAAACGGGAYDLAVRVDGHHGHAAETAPAGADDVAADGCGLAFVTGGVIGRRFGLDGGFGLLGCLRLGSWDPWDRTAETGRSRLAPPWVRDRRRCLGGSLIDRVFERSLIDRSLNNGVFNNGVFNNCAINNCAINNCAINNCAINNCAINNCVVNRRFVRRWGLDDRLGHGIVREGGFRCLFIGRSDGRCTDV